MMNQTKRIPKIVLSSTLVFFGIIIFLAAPIYADTPLPAFTVAWGTNGSNEGEFRSPTGIAVDNSGNVYVVDELNDRVQKFTYNGQFLLEWGGQGSAPGQFLAPTDVAVDNAGNVYVTDTDNNRIQKFTATGSFISQWGTFGTANGHFRYPRGIVVDNASSAIYVVDQHNHRIQKFSLTGAFLLAWGEYDPPDGTRGDPGEFDLPTGIALDNIGQVYVTDTFNNRIQKFTPNGVFLGQGGSQGSGAGQFNSPTGIAIDQTNNVYVADTNNHRIQLFDTSGNYQGQWGTPGSGNGQFLGPGGVAAVGPGEVYVTDVGNNRVQKFGGLWLTKQAGTIAPVAGEQMMYIIKITNNGPVTATQALISDTLDSNLQLAGLIQLVPQHPEAVVATSALSLPVIASNVTLASSSMLTITVPVTVNAGLFNPTAIFNTAAITSSEFVFVSRGTALVIVNPYRHYLPIIIKQFP
jgi:uncharacterized repeat protein (TIGR01451 family)